MKFTKKQWMMSGAVVVLLAGGSAGVIANNQAQAHAEKTAQEAKTAHDKLIKEAKKATEKAEAFKAEADVKPAQDAIKKLEEKDKTALIARVERVRQNWDLVNKADKAVASAEKVQNDANVKTAQSAIDKIKAEMAKSKKADLQKRLDKVKTAVKNNKERAKAKAAEEAKSKANVAQETQATQAPTQTQNEVQVAEVNSGAVPQGDTSVPVVTVDAGQNAPAPEPQAGYTPAPAPSYTAPSSQVGKAQAPVQTPPATGNAAYNNGGGLNANSHKSVEEIGKWIEDANNNPGGFESANGGR